MIYDGVIIAAGVTIHAQACVMEECRIGAGTTIFPGAVLYERTVVGRRCLIHAAAVLGAYGFGYRQVDGRHALSPQLGHVVIEDDVEIGAWDDDRPRHLRRDGHRLRHETRRSGDDRAQLPHRAA